MADPFERVIKLSPSEYETIEAIRIFATRLCELSGQPAVAEVSLKGSAFAGLDGGIVNTSAGEVRVKVRW